MTYTELARRRSVEVRIVPYRAKDSSGSCAIARSAALLAMRHTEVIAWPSATKTTHTANTRMVASATRARTVRHSKVAALVPTPSMLLILVIL